jgi:hypothetical protein
VKTIRGLGWPLWNPYIFAGHPSFADPLFQPFYPVFAGLGLLLGAARGLAVGLWLHVVLAAVLTYGFLRTIGCLRYAAAAGAITYSLSGYIVTWFETTFWVSTLSLLPGILWAFELAVRRRQLRYVALTSVVMALAVLGGQIAFLVTFMLLGVLYAFGRTLELARRGARAYAWPMLVIGMSAGIAALLSAIQTVPFAEFLGLSRRLISRGLADPLPMQQLVTLLVPNFYGNPATTVPYRGEMNYSEGTVYAGLLALMLACAAFFVARRFYVWYLSLVTVVVLYVIVGGPGVDLFGTFPILKYLSLHRSLFLLPLLISVLAAIALSQPRPRVGLFIGVGCALTVAIGLAILLNLGDAQAHWESLRGYVLWAVVLLIAGVGLLVLKGRWPSADGALGWALMGLVFIDLFVFGSRFNPAGPISELMPPTSTTDYLQTRTPSDRVVTYQLSDVVFGPNVLSIFDVAEIGGYSSIVLARYHQLVAAGDPTIDIPWMDRSYNMVTFSHPTLRLLDLFQASFAVSPLPLGDPGIRAEYMVDVCEGESEGIGVGSAVSGSLAVKETAINRLDLRFRVRDPMERSGELSVRMWQGSDRNRLILDARLEAINLEDEETVTLYFEPEREAPGRVYTWEVAAPTETHTGIRLCTSAGGQPAVSVYGADWSQVHADTVYTFERLAPLPRAYVVYAAELIVDEAQVVERLLDDSFDLRNVAVTAEPTGLPTVADRPATPAEIVSRSDTQVEIRAAAAQRGLLVLADQHYPGWQVSVDGQAAVLLRVNHVFRGVMLEPGDHEVIFRFEPSSLSTGGWLSAIGVVVLMCILALGRHPRLASWLRSAEHEELEPREGNHNGF